MIPVTKSLCRRHDRPAINKAPVLSPAIKPGKIKIISTIKIGWTELLLVLTIMRGYSLTGRLISSR
jgi:hypothetical protein